MRPSISEELSGLREDPSFQASLRSIRPGKVRRDGSDPVYEARREYTRRLRRFVYDPAAMNTILTSPELKERFFRTFGYTGSLDFTIYPNAWLRDLPLLDIGAGAYLADGIVLGTNQVTRDQSELRVGPIGIGARTIFDQRCMVGLGATIGADCVIGIQSLVGLGSTIGDGTTVSGNTRICHYARIGRGVTLGYDVFVGLGAEVADGVVVPDCARIPAHARVTAEGTQEQAVGRGRR